jgi:alpha-beta hydrolase superfamily lysophospholipase
MEFQGMNAVIEIRGKSTEPETMRPVYFNSAERMLFGWLHPARSSTANLGVVICNPFGYEAMCSHRSLRTFAEASAAAGYPSLRFDYSGCGDSEDIDPGTDQIEAWCQDVVFGAAELKRQTGVTRVCLLGLRLGGLIATMASMNMPSISSLILIAPIVEGRRYLKELRRIRMAASLSEEPGEPAQSAQVTAARSMEVSGFTLFEATLNSLKETDLAKLERAPAPSILVIDGEGSSPSDALLTRLGALGVRTAHKSLPGLVEMAMTPPQLAAVPREMVSAATEWLNSTRDGEPSSAKKTYASDQQHKTFLTLPKSTEHQQTWITELPTFIAASANLFGIITEPQAGETRRRAVILLNAGVDHHIGPSRMYVSLARQWARQGYVVLRLDIAGVGDSFTAPGAIDDDVFPETAIIDIRAAVDFLRQNYHVADITLAGLCSGAYHALRAAVAGVPVNRILMVNPQNFFWKKGMTLDALQLAEVVRNPAVYKERARSLKAWSRLLTGQVNVWRIFKIFLQRVLLTVESSIRDFARNLHVRLPQDLGSDIEEIAARGVQIVFVFAPREAGIGLLKLQAGSSVNRLGDKCRVHIVASGDHIFSQLDARTMMEHVLSKELFTRAANAPIRQDPARVETAADRSSKTA